ncbi:hypothetical protein [Prochlorococcus marinus]|uniref:hypothetical protein n=1 Tax=Prochlorococcus marinus TaxID=1219 RepID=UPI0022B4B967|nr:hypothetical protein [Prochlorococcus marinus]
MRITLILSVLFLLGAILTLEVYRFFPDYKSAFEADQQCHYEALSLFEVEGTLECDHDLETRQWILFSAGKNNEKATVFKRFRY